MWEPFTENTSYSIMNSQREADSLGNNYIGTEHFLLGIISMYEKTNPGVLGYLGIDKAKVIKDVEFICGKGAHSCSEMVLTPRARHIIELSFEEASNLRHKHISPEHILLAIMKDNAGVAARILDNLGVTYTKIMGLFDVNLEVNFKSNQKGIERSL